MATANDWPYHKDRHYSPAAALEAQYSGLLKRDPMLAACVQQIRMNELAIDARMAQLAAIEPDED